MTRAVLDASVGVAAVLALPYSAEATALLRKLRGAEIVVPVLWEYEVVSTLRKAVASGSYAPDAAERALDRLLTLPDTRVAPDPTLHRAALRWADRIGQIVAYDAQYLALAERLEAELWTADRRLVERAREAGADWVHHVGETPS
ncbi:MAG: type II toxin-antitoxin system VapC family toxin [Chloroflexi bacterium]|nr:type II toxin-antitoxin system VapC family toxin [Chloroflexota bacterium]